MAAVVAVAASDADELEITHVAADGGIEAQQRLLFVSVLYDLRRGQHPPWREEAARRD